MEIDNSKRDRSSKLYGYSFQYLSFQFLDQGFILAMSPCSLEDIGRLFANTDSRYENPLN